MAEGLPLSDRLDMCVAVMTTLGLPFPSSFTADAERADLATVLPKTALVLRSTGPYSPNRLPDEHERMITLIELRWRGQFEKPDLTVAAGGDWPELVMMLPLSRVFVRLLMPEAGLAGAASRWELGLTADVKMALRWVAVVLRQAGEPAARVDVTYPADPEADRERARLPPDFQDRYPRMVGTVGVDLRSCQRQQRQAFDAAARAAAYSDQVVEALLGGGVTTRLGFARVRAHH